MGAASSKASGPTASVGSWRSLQLKEIPAPHLSNPRSLHRRNIGELVENVASPGEYHGMAGNFLKYAGPLNWNDLPVDAHELIALCAPRSTFINYGASTGPGADGQ